MLFCEFTSFTRFVSTAACERIWIARTTQRFDMEKLADSLSGKFKTYIIPNAKLSDFNQMNLS